MKMTLRYSYGILMIIFVLIMIIRMVMNMIIMLIMMLMLMLFSLFNRSERLLNVGIVRDGSDEDDSAEAK